MQTPGRVFRGFFFARPALGSIILRVAMRRTHLVRLVAAWPWLAVWLVLVLVGTLMHWGTWIGPRAGVETLLNRGALKLAANVSAVLAAPGWIICTLAIKRLAAESVAVAVTAHGIAWLLWLCCGALALRMRARALGRAGTAPTRRAAAPVLDRPAPEGAAAGAVVSRRRVLVDGTCALAGVGLATTLARGTLVAPWDCQVVRYRVPIRDLPASLSGLRLVYISDTHLGPRVSAAYIRGVLERAVDLNPDVFLLGGDYVHNGPRQIAPAAALFKPLVATGKPVIGVLGNHDWYADGAASTLALQDVGVRMIDNDRVFIDAGTRTLKEDAPAAGLCVAGVGDLWQHVVDPVAAFRGVPPEMARVLLSHNPDAAEEPVLVEGRAGGPPAPAPRVDLMLSGHTHGGQVKLPMVPPLIVPSRFRFKYARGLVQGPAFPVLVSAGVGVSLIPVRIGVAPEVLEVELERTA